MFNSAPYTPLTVEAALAEPALAEVRVVAGGAGLSRAVRSVGVLDVEDLAGVAADQFVLSSAYPLMTADTGVLLGRLAEQSASALGVKSEGYWRKMPGPLVMAADRLGLPLLELPPGPFDDLVNPLLAAIAGRQAEELRRAADLHEALTQTILAQADLRAVAATLARVLGLPAAIVDEHGDLLADVGVPQGEPPRAVAEQAVALEGVGEGTGSAAGWLLGPISALGRFYGAVCVRGKVTDDAFVRSALTEAAMVSGMLLAGYRRIEAVHRRFERELLDDLVDRRLVGAAQAVERARRIGWANRRPYLVLVAGRLRKGARPLRPIIEPGFGDETIPVLSRALRTLPFQVRLYLRRPGLCVIVHLDELSRADVAVEAVTRRLTGEENGVLGPNIVVGVSRPRTELLDLPNAFREAALAVSVSPRIRTGARRVELFTDLGAARLAAEVQDLHALARIAREALGSRADPTVPATFELLETLAVLLDHNMSIAETAAELFFHYNTVRHRLGRLREILGERLETSHGRTLLALAIACVRVLEAEAHALSPRLGGLPAGESESAWWTLVGSRAAQERSSEVRQNLVT